MLHKKRQTIKGAIQLTIRDFLTNIQEQAAQLRPREGGRPFDELMIDTTQIWSNEACKGYCILAMQDAGFEADQIRAVLSAMRWAFDEKTVEEAEEAYNQF